MVIDMARARRRKILKGLAAKLGKSVSEVKSEFMRNVMTALKLYVGKESFGTIEAWRDVLRRYLGTFLNTAYDLAEKLGRVPTPQEILEAVRTKVVA